MMGSDERSHVSEERDEGTGAQRPVIESASGTTDPEPPGPQNPEPGNPGDDGPAAPGDTGTPSGPSGIGPAGGAGTTTGDDDGDRGLLETIGDLLTGNDRDEAPEEELEDDKTPLEGPAAHARACWKRPPCTCIPSTKWAEKCKCASRALPCRCP